MGEWAFANCQVSLSATNFSRELPFNVQISSSGVTSVEVAVNVQSGFAALATTNGMQNWPGNSFSSGSYILYFQGKKPDGSIISCSPAAQFIVISEH